MATFMKMLNNISRAQAIYRQERICVSDLKKGHYALVLTICRAPGRSQEELAEELCLNKSTIARSLAYLEEKGYITRALHPTDKRQFLVHPTEKMKAVYPELRQASLEWRVLLSEGISEEELRVFDSVLGRMEARAREIIERQEERK